VSERGLDYEERAPRREERARLLEEVRAARVGVRPGEELVQDVAHRDEVEAPPRGEVRERPARAGSDRRVPLARRDRLARLRREGARGGERPGGAVGGDHLGGAGVEGGERDRPGTAPEVEDRARPARQLGEGPARLEVRDRPVEQEVRAEEPLLIQVARAGELALAREPPRQPLDRARDLAQLLGREGLRGRAERGRRAPRRAPPAGPSAIRGARAGSCAARGAPRRDEARHPAEEVLGEVGHGAAL
jgi:hypothetical protein